ncbi:osmotically inducible protein OsmC [Catalinimonas alkaloidigena]|uniref:Osmotically inducible protein OsmC n=1 Tax=Catalinimonas alkaloidigena TaxID=1075417 RepID=A0A1G8ZZT6_9BACT|nr:OsmC family protein [Catalinimonas alkaloidigena]SDK20521.1 osmotically inducible protein OsmC [Catalinimonas alkaloidigena]
MATRNASAVWNGTLKEGNGTIKSESGVLTGAKYSFKTRFEEEKGTNPEELIGAAHAACFSMALSAGLGKAGYTPQSVETEAKVHLAAVEGGFKISKIELSTEAEADDLSDDEFQKIAEATKENCPVSVALKNVPIELKARLKQAN